MCPASFVRCRDLHIVSSSVLSMTCSLTIHVPRDCEILRFNIGSEHVIKSLCLIEYSGERQSVCLHVAFFLRVHTFCYNGRVGTKGKGAFSARVAAPSLYIHVISYMRYYCGIVIFINMFLCRRF